MADFNPALPLPIKWTIGDDRFVEGGQVLSLTIPVDSVTHLIDHLQSCLAVNQLGACSLILCAVLAQEQ